MARQLHKLTARSVEALNEPGRHSDGGGLYLVVNKGGSKQWAYLYRQDGKLREMGLGGVPAVGLKQARTLAQQARDQRAAGLDPISEKKQARETRNAKQGGTFGAFAEDWVPQFTATMRNAKHQDQWLSTLRTYAAPIWNTPLDEVTTDDVLAILKPIWLEKNETASRVRMRIEKVFDAARARKLVAGENPARWKGQLQALLPPRQKLQRGHFEALDYRKLPDVMAALCEKDALSAPALRFLILTAARSGEVRGATWEEVDLANGLWVIPAARMKAGKGHRVPLSEPAMSILQDLHESRVSPLVFPGRSLKAPMSDMTLAKMFRSVLAEEDKAATVHGLRSSFRDWCAEETNTPREIAEAALAHAVGNEVERAYRRGDALEKRRGLMERWAGFCVKHAK